MKEMVEHVPDAWVLCAGDHIGRRAGGWSLFVVRLDGELSRSLRDPDATKVAQDLDSKCECFAGRRRWLSASGPSLSAVTGGMA